MKPPHKEFKISFAILRTVFPLECVNVIVFLTFRHIGSWPTASLFFYAKKHVNVTLKESRTRFVPMPNFVDLIQPITQAHCLVHFHRRVGPDFVVVVIVGSKGLYSLMLKEGNKRIQLHSTFAITWLLKESLNALNSFNKDSTCFNTVEM